MENENQVPESNKIEESIPAKLPDTVEEMPPTNEFQGGGIDSQDLTPEQRRTLIGVIVAILVVFIATIISIVWLAQPTTDTARVRDIFIIFMALSSLLTTFVLIVLIIQLARLLNLLQNELGPILDSLNETISNLRGTTVFLSENLTEPVIKLNEYLAGLSQLFGAIGLVRKTKKPKDTKGV
jgi:hypothetical protein